MYMAAFPLVKMGRHCCQVLFKELGGPYSRTRRPYRSKAAIASGEFMAGDPSSFNHCPPRL